MDNTIKNLNYNFIKTTDKETAELLFQLGFVEIPESTQGSFCFINDTTLRFEDSIDLSKVYFSNDLCI